MFVLHFHTWCFGLSVGFCRCKPSAVRFSSNEQPEYERMRKYHTEATNRFWSIVIIANLFGIQLVNKITIGRWKSVVLSKPGIQQKVIVSRLIHEFEVLVWWGRRKDKFIRATSTFLIHSLHKHAHVIRRQYIQHWCHDVLHTYAHTCWFHNGLNGWLTVFMEIWWWINITKVIRLGMLVNEFESLLLYITVECTHIFLVMLHIERMLGSLVRWALSRQDALVHAQTSQRFSTYNANRVSTCDNSNTKVIRASVVTSNKIDNVI